MRKWMVLVVCGLLAMTTTGCSNTSVDVPNLDDYQQKEEIVEKAPLTGKYIMQDSKTAYKIVLNAQASPYEQLAATELQYFIKDATGKQLQIITDDKVQYSPNNQYFCIGENNVFYEAGFTINEEERIELASSGLKVVTKDNSLFLYGGEEEGTLFAVYEWLEQELDYEYFTENIWTIQKNVTEIPLRNYNIKKVPDFDIRFLSQRRISDNTLLNSRLKLSHTLCRDDLLINGKTQGTDGQLERTYLSKQIYGKDHPNWYSNGTQMCFTASAASTSYNDQEYQALVNELTEILKNSFMTDDGTRVVFGGYDGWSYCECNSCFNMAQQYGSQSGSFIRLCNDVYTKVDAWMDSEEGKPYAREWVLEFLAYAGYQDPPIKENEKGERVPTITCVEGVGAFFAPIRTEFAVSMEHEDNLEHKQRLSDWGKVTNNHITAWLYSPNYKNYMCPLDASLNLVENMQLLKEVDCDYFFLEGQDHQGGISTGYDMLKVYVCSKAMWDVNVNVENLIQRWFSVVYGKADSIMYETFVELRINLFEMYNKGFKNRLTNYYMYSEQKIYWNKDLLVRWIDSYNKAIETVEKQGGAQETITMIRAERMSPVYYLLKLYSNEMTSNVLEYYAEMFFADAELCQLNTMRESQMETLDTFKKEIGYNA